MSVASFALCKELYELSGWVSDRAIWGDLLPNERGFSRPIIGYEYDLGYLLRKLPRKITHRIGHNLEISPVTPSGVAGWRATYTSEPYAQYAQTPEDAACKLAIELFKQGILEPVDE